MPGNKISFASTPLSLNGEREVFFLFFFLSTKKTDVQYAKLLDGPGLK